MTTKTKVLKILDKYRDMSLTMGCEIQVIFMDEPLKITRMGEEDSSYKNGVENRTDRILGHKPTPLVLLKALGANENVAYASCDSDGELSITTTDDELVDNTVSISIPDVTTLSEIPEEHKMWQAVLDVLI